VSRSQRNLFGAGLMLGFGVCGWLVASGYYLTTPRDVAGQSQVFHITRGESLADIGNRLVDGGLVSRHAPLSLWGRLAGADRRMRQGAFKISPAQTPLEILGTLISGRSIPLRVTLPEGLTCRQMLERISQTLDLPMTELLAAASDSVWLRSLGVPGSPEGYLFPETYFFDAGSEPRVILERLIRTGIERVDAGRLTRAQVLGMTRHQLLTMASIIEAESGLPIERRRIAAVYRNRLLRGWPLQADPTVAYGVGHPGQKLTAADLGVNSPYNTYQHAGLPPGPICSPGMTSIDAALWPLEACPDLFFVARGDGGHVFSQTLQEHNLARRLIGRN
jgi:UPF0755 protein